MTDQLPGQLARACTELCDARTRYLKQADEGYDPDWSRGMAMGIALALDFIHQWTRGTHGKPLHSAPPRKEAS